MIDAGDIAIAVLAGGAGSRIGGRKPMLRLGKTTLVERAFERARLWSNEAVVVVRSPQQLEAFPAPYILDAEELEGPLAGLAVALEWAEQRTAGVLMTIPCDMPFLPDDLPTRLCGAIDDHMSALASSGGQLHPVCGLWRVRASNAVAAYCASGRSSLRGFASELGFVMVDWPSEPRDPFFNINNPDDLKQAEIMLRG